MLKRGYQRDCDRQRLIRWQADISCILGRISCSSHFRPKSNISQFTHYFAFCAIVVLYVYTIQQHTAQDERYRRYFDAAAKCQSQITAMAQQASLAQRYGVVLEELRLEAIKQTRNIGHNMASTQPNWQRNIDTVLGHLPNHANDEGNILGTEQGHSGFDSTSNGGFDSHNATPTSLLADLTSWGNFDSLVRSVRVVSWKFC